MSGVTFDGVLLGVHVLLFQVLLVFLAGLVVERLLQLEAAGTLVLFQLVPLLQGTGLLLLDLLVALLLQSHNHHVLLVLQGVVEFLVLLSQLRVNAVGDLAGVHLHHRRNLPLRQMVRNGHFK